MSLRKLLLLAPFAVLFAACGDKEEEEHSDSGEHDDHEGHEHE